MVKLPKKACVVFDTNIWVSSRMLKDPMGATLLYSLGKIKGKVGLPEIIEDELKKNVTKFGLKACGNIENNFRLIKMLMGKISDYKLPTEQQLKTSIESRLADLDTFLERIQFTLAHAKSALDRVNSEQPPNGPSDQQFKDSAIWEALLELSNRYIVHFVTEDKDFYKDSDYEKGIAINLAEELSGGREIHIYPDIAPCLKVIARTQPKIPIKKLADKINLAIKDALQKDIGDRPFQLGQLIKFNITAFITEKIGIVALSFELTNKLICIPVSDEPIRYNASVLAKGECLYNLKSGEAFDVKLDSCEYTWYDQEGRSYTNRSAYVYADSIIHGTRILPYRLREEIDL